MVSISWGALIAVIVLSACAGWLVAALVFAGRDK